ncbi:hypothetical protein EU537_00065 [Candidatus Thorarchaeota archaeon]|nr:MAG: hypothetical protein EU537_00065 [Candidatus Thorarchaeota archaeon]
MGVPGGTVQTLYIMTDTLPRMFLRHVFIYLVSRYYLGLTAKRKILIFAVIVEVQPILLYYFPYLVTGTLFLWPWMILLSGFPIPSLTVAALTPMKTRPRPDHALWAEKRKNG